MSITRFMETTPSLGSYWRAIIARNWGASSPNSVMP